MTLFDQSSNPRVWAILPTPSAGFKQWTVDMVSAILCARRKLARGTSITIQDVASEAQRGSGVFIFPQRSRGLITNPPTSPGRPITFIAVMAIRGIDYPTTLSGFGGIVTIPRGLRIRSRPDHAGAAHTQNFIGTAPCHPSRFFTRADYGQFPPAGAASSVSSWTGQTRRRPPR